MFCSFAATNFSVIAWQMIHVYMRNHKSIFCRVDEKAAWTASLPPRSYIAAQNVLLEFPRMRAEGCPRERQITNVRRWEKITLSALWTRFSSWLARRLEQWNQNMCRRCEQWQLSRNDRCHGIHWLYAMYKKCSSRRCQTPMHCHRNVTACVCCCCCCFPDSWSRRSHARLYANMRVLARSHTSSITALATGAWWFRWSVVNIWWKTLLVSYVKTIQWADGQRHDAVARKKNTSTMNWTEDFVAWQINNRMCYSLAQRDSFSPVNAPANLRQRKAFYLFYLYFLMRFQDSVIIWYTGVIIQMVRSDRMIMYRWCWSCILLNFHALHGHIADVADFEQSKRASISRQFRHLIWWRLSVSKAHVLLMMNLQIFFICFRLALINRFLNNEATLIVLHPRFLLLQSLMFLYNPLTHN